MDEAYSGSVYVAAVNMLLIFSNTASASSPLLLEACRAMALIAFVYDRTSGCIGFIVVALLRCPNSSIRRNNVIACSAASLSPENAQASNRKWNVFFSTFICRPSCGVDDDGVPLVASILPIIRGLPITTISSVTFSKSAVRFRRNCGS